MENFSKIRAQYGEEIPYGKKFKFQKVFQIAKILYSGIFRLGELNLKKISILTTRRYLFYRGIIPKKASKRKFGPQTLMKQPTRDKYNVLERCRYSTHY